MVEKDISLFLEEFRKTEQTLSDFNYLWKRRNMSCIIYCSPNPKEQYDYIKELLEYLVVGIDRGILIGKGTIFILYAYFVIQPPNPWQRINIPITNEELKNFKSLVQAYCDNQEHDVVYLFNKLLAVQAFEVVPTHDTIIWGNKFVPKDRFVSFHCKKDAISKPNAVDSLFYDGSVIRKLETLSLDYSKVKESVSDGKVMLDCVSQDLSHKIRGFEQEFQKEVVVLRGGQPVNLDLKAKRSSVKQKAMNAPIDDRTPHQRKRAKKKDIKEEEIEIKPAQYLSDKEKGDYIPFPIGPG
ncbi:hypothetical protein ACHWQZ_G008813 [Mnemiopsis leidyi]